MNVRQLFAALFALLALLLLVSLSACTDAGKCVRGEEGCVCRAQGADDGRCNSGLSCTDNVCQDTGGSGDGDGDGDGDFEPRDAGARPELGCNGETQEEVCAAFCDMFCYNQVRFCGRSECEIDHCEEGGLVYNVCANRCRTIECARQLCEDQVDPTLTCDDYGTESDLEGEPYFETLCLDRDPLCVQHHDIGCSDVCGTDNGVGGQLVGNGTCEDGAESSEASLCDRGTDCTDCTPHPCKVAGARCENHGDCCGFYGDGALCVDPDDDPRTGEVGPLPPACNPVCDPAAEEPCPDNFNCTRTSIGKWVCVQER